MSDMSADSTTIAPGARARTGPGRPRDPQVDSAVATAVFALLSEVGFARLSITAVAQRAGVGKPAIYRRWRSKAEMVVDVLGQAAAVAVPVPDTGTLRGDLEQIYGQMVALHHLGAGRVQLALAAELPFDDELAATYRERFVTERRARLQSVLQRAIARGEVRADLDLEVATDLGVGVIQHRAMVTAMRLDDEVVASLVDLLVRAFAPDPA
jgi:AcrR family transcriptional regulator